MDPLSPEHRAKRLASWGPATAQSARLANRLVDRFQRVTGGSLVGEMRSHMDAQKAPPSVPPTKLDTVSIDALARIAPLRSDDDSRRAYSLGKSWPDLVAARATSLDRVCDAVVRPRSEEELERAMEWCIVNDLAVVPVGGGTSVTGGIEALSNRPEQPVVAFDVSALSACLDIDHKSGVATFQTGIRGPELERVLATFGMTLGHTPQSFEYSTLGGWLATRSAGQLSLRYGKIESMTAALKLLTPSGDITVDHVPAHGAGSDIRELVLGSEGTLGIITQATMRVHARPEMVSFATYIFPSFDEAQLAARNLMQSHRPGMAPAMVRISDAAETAFNIGASVPKMLGGRGGRLLANMLGLSRGAMVIVLNTGTKHEVRLSERLIDRHMKGFGAKALGSIPAKAWYHGRFTQPYARDLMMDNGLLVDTLETSASWAHIPDLHTEVRAAIENSFGAGKVVVGAHLSHLYHDGASVYFTFLAAASTSHQLELWREAKRSVHEVIARGHGAASHQHGVGTMHPELYSAVTSPLAVDALHAMKIAVDPAGACNPGKLYKSRNEDFIPINGVSASGASGGTTVHIDRDSR